MNVIKIKSTRGLGANIGLVSLFMHTKEPVTLHLGNDMFSIWSTLKRVLGLDRIHLILDNNIPESEDFFLDDTFFDKSKFFVDYFRPKTIVYMDKHINFKKPYGKRAICLLMYNDTNGIMNSTDKDNIEYTKYPYGRQYSIEDYMQIFKLIRSAGYDVITIDSLETRLDDKIYAMATYCDAVIGYEGGLQHLAHTLDIPSFVLPWRYNVINNDPLNHLVTHAMHLDRKTYFCESIDECLSWTSDMFINKLNQLKAGLGNNIFFDPKTSLTINKSYTMYQLGKGKASDIFDIASKTSVKFTMEQFSELKISGQIPIKIGDLCFANS